jgi:hypothetical protein
MVNRYPGPVAAHAESATPGDWGLLPQGHHTARQRKALPPRADELPLRHHDPGTVSRYPGPGVLPATASHAGRAVNHANPVPLKPGPAPHTGPGPGA